MTKFSKLKVEERFTVKDGTMYQKLGELIYRDVAVGLETYWDPQFDATIILPNEGDPGFSNDKFTIDPQTRVVIPNPAYKNAEGALQSLHASGLFECDSKDYESIVSQCIKWGQAARDAKAAQGPGAVAKKLSKKKR